ncbi:MAG TPA: AI-2E family transporter [Methylomirabilota bacterium]|nr:AI-2E family transporter [Methylomirabilota bacterium]
MRRRVLATGAVASRRAPRYRLPGLGVAREPLRAAQRFMVFAGLALVVACLYWAREVLIPIAAAVLISFALSPLVSGLQRTGMRRGFAVAAVVTAALMLALGLGWAVVRQVTAFADDLPRYQQVITRKINEIQRVGTGGTLAKMQDTAEGVMKQLDKPGGGAQRPVPVVVSEHPLWRIPNLVAALITGFMVLVLVIFMLVQQRELIARVIRLFGYERMAATTRLLQEAGIRISGYLLMQGTVNACFGLGVGMGLFLIGLPFALALGCLAAVLRFLPYVGPWLGALLPVALSLAVFDGWARPLMIMGLFAVTEVAVAFVIEPLVYGRRAGVSAIALLVAAAFWTWLWGPIGLALATPLTVCLVVISRAVGGLEFIEILMSDDPPVQPCLTFYQRVLAGDAAEAAALVAETARAASLEAAFDGVVAPALARARHDLETDQLSREEYQRFLDLVRGLIADVPAPEPDPGAALPPHTRGAVMGCALRDEADALGLAMLNRLLEPLGGEMPIVTGSGLVGEALAEVDAARPTVLCIGAIGVGGRRRMRHLVKRLRHSESAAIVMTGRWGAGPARDVRAELAATGADETAASLAEARAAILRRLHEERPS